MKKGKRLLPSFMLAFSIVGFFTSTFFCLAAFIKFQETDDLAYGKIGLRSYFHCGSGTQDDPYVITRPRHLFNLSRLQSLGVFGDKNYFQLGYQIDSEHFGFYKGDTSEYSSVLDMTDQSIISIGSEATPFYGVFEGNGMIISNLTVKASLEDSGMFGYVASGAIIQNLLLDNVTICNDGYTSSFDDFYSSAAEDSMKKKTSFIVRQGDASVSYSYVEGTDGTIQNNVTNTNAILSGTTASFTIERSGTMPSFEVHTESSTSNINYSLLMSDDFLSKTDHESKFPTFILNDDSKDNPMQNIFSFFDEIEKQPAGTISYPLTLAMTISSVASLLDSQGINHSKVISSLNISFEKKRAGSPLIMYVQPRDIQHGNNIGLVIGHLDGSCLNVFVHNGVFQINDSTDMTSVDQKSMTGFIGLIGPSVSNKASENAKGGVAIQGKDVGVLDFTDIYNSVVGTGTFKHETTPLSSSSDYYSYEPISPDNGNEYFEYLRYKEKNTDTTRYTEKEKSLSLIGKTVIEDDDSHNRGLGVFKIATDYLTTGHTDHLFERSDKSRITKSKDTSSQAGTNTYIKNDATHVFYSTFEYKKENNNRYSGGISTLLDCIKNPYYNGYYQTSRLISPGYYIPSDTTLASQDLYESYYNFLFRFSLDSNRNSFYFNDLDDTSIGGQFLSNYFQSKLVDEEGNRLSRDSSQFGLMIKDKNRNNISELTTCFPLNGNEGSANMYVFNEDKTQPSSGDILTNQASYVVGNSINFEIKTDMANVTILASNSNKESGPDTSGSMLGIYKLNNTLKKVNSLDNIYAMCDESGNLNSWSTPDYGMVLSANFDISYFNYDGSGNIGTASLDDKNFTKITSNDMGSKSLAIIGQSSYSTSLASPIFAHTFKLPKGRYCLGSAIGCANVYYICAQGQDDGDISLSANVFNSQNKVENIDFLKNTSEAIFQRSNNQITFNADTAKKARCFLIFDSGNVTRFNAASKNANSNKFKMRMEYKEDSDSFFFTLIDGSSIDRLTSISLVNYGVQDVIGAKNITVNLFNGALISDSKKITYPR